MTVLKDWVAADLATPLPEDVGELARHLARTSGIAAIIFYGSVLRTGNLDDLLDFYVLTDSASQRPLIWPRISFHTVPVGSRVIRAKVATMPLSLFAEAPRGRLLDTTIWARFCQPSALAWARDADVASDVAAAVASSIVTAARYAAALGPAAAPAEAFWTALFTRTYGTEFRIENAGRSAAAIVAHDPERYAELLALAWKEAGIAFAREGEILRPDLPLQEAVALARGWRRRNALGKGLNILRMANAALTDREAGSYAVWKIERHAGVDIAATRWQREHPFLATPGLLWQLSRARARRRS